MRIKSVSYKEKERILMGALRRARPLTLKEEFSGSAAAPFVGRFGYPEVNVGILAPPTHLNDVWKFDAPTFWSRSQSSISQIVDYRSSMIKSTFKDSVRSKGRMVEIAQDIALSKNTVDVDVELKKKPTLGIKTNQWHAPHGPSSALKRIDLASNPKVPTKVQRFFDDTDAKASLALTSLFKRDIDENKLSRMLSVGSFGMDRRLVPTRWSITATDDILAKDIIKAVKDCPIGDRRAYFGGYLGNYFMIIFFERPWSYELFEMYVNPDELQFSTDYEPNEGRKKYAEQCAGGFYAPRLAITEKLKADKRQNSVLTLRFITDEYVLPLGVWVTREAARIALSNKPVSFGSDELMLAYAKKLAKRKFNLDIGPVLKKSIMLKQKSLRSWF